MISRTRISIGSLLCLLMLVGCASEPLTSPERRALVDEGGMALRQMKAADPTLTYFLDGAYGYAIFPSVGKGGLIAGGAHGHGAVYEHDVLIGYSELTQASIGAQIGGETYSELVIFENKDALQRFNNGKITTGASLSAVALTAGKAKSTRFIDGVAIFTRTIGGLNAEAAVSGQQFTFSPK